MSHFKFRDLAVKPRQHVATRVSVWKASATNQKAVKRRQQRVGIGAQIVRLSAGGQNCKSFIVASGLLQLPRFDLIGLIAVVANP